MNTRVGLVGLGVRGGMAMDRLPLIPGVELAAFCEVRRNLVDKYQSALETLGHPRAREFVGPDAWRDMCAWDGIDVVYICSPWHLHVPIALAAMECGKHALVEVPAAFTVEECWQLVEISERTGRYCMQLENCCYGEMEMLALSLTRYGKLGDIIHGEGAYLHDLRKYNYNSPAEDAEWHYHDYWRLKWNAEHKGNQYCTHGLGPICQAMGVNRGDRLTRVVSMETASRGFVDYANAKLPNGDRRAKLDVAMGDLNTTLVQTANGRTIMLQHDIATPRPYSRLNNYIGTRGIFMDYPYRVAWEDEIGKGAHKYFDADVAEKIRADYMHPQWKYAGKLAVEVGGHDGMDLIMDLRWVYCLQNNLPLDFDVYDLASWCCLGELTEKSAREGSTPQEIPDFTRGRWANRAPLAIEPFDAALLDIGSVRKMFELKKK